MGAVGGAERRICPAGSVDRPSSQRDTGTPIAAQFTITDYASTREGSNGDLKRQMTIDDIRELVVDNFAGGGGASTGIFLAIGRSVDIAINHDQAAIAMHKANHPETRHFCESVWEVDPRKATGGQPVGLAWFSPDCTHFSKAKGGKPVSKKIRGLAWVAIRWAAQVRPRVIMLENVEEFVTWGPIVDGQPDPNRKGKTFQAFVNKLKKLGYQVDWKELRACDYGAPTIRKRFFLVARCDGRPIVWPQPTHGDPNSPAVKSGKLKPWRTAAEIIDWSIPCPSIFDRKRPLKENTLRRIARGIKRFIIDNQNPFVIRLNYPKSNQRERTIDEPMQTATAKNDLALINPFIVPVTHHGSDRVAALDKPLPTVTAAHRGEFALIAPVVDRQFTRSVGHRADEPVGTITAGGSGKTNLVAAFLAQYHSETKGDHVRGQTMDRPILTVDTSNRYGLVTSNLIKLRGTCADGQPVTEPMPTITAGGLHVGEVRAFLLKYYGTADDGQAVDEPLHTVTSKARFGLVTIEGEDYQIVDIGMRMLEPHELFAAQGFPQDYIIDRDCDGNRYSKAAQVARCGNAVPPPFTQALVEANLPEMCGRDQRWQTTGA